MRATGSGGRLQRRGHKRLWRSEQGGEDGSSVQMPRMGGGHDAGEDLLGPRAPAHVRFPPHTLRVTTAGRMACLARQLLASMRGLSGNVKIPGNSTLKCAANRRLSAKGAGVSIRRLSRVSK